MIAINNGKSDFHLRWINYCKKNNIPYKIVDCYANNIVEELQDCKALMWHFHQGNLKDNIIAKQIIFALEHSGFKVFPNFKTCWHFDDKLSQKYLFESFGAPTVKSYAFYNKNEAISWANSTSYPKVFKLRGGAGSQNVFLVNSKIKALKIINKAFKNGFSKYNSYGNFKDKWRKYRLGMIPFFDILKAFIRLFIAPKYARLSSREVGYVYFQDFIPNNDFDIRIVVIGEKAFGVKRYVRKGDFRASGSGVIDYDKDFFDERCIKISFDLNLKLGIQVGCYDFVFDKNNNPLVIELSYGFDSKSYDSCPGYWDKDLKWHDGETIKEDWMVDLIIEEIKNK